MSILIPSLLEIIGNYVDLRTYAGLININDKVFTLSKYEQLKIEYESKFAKEIEIAFINKFTEMKKLGQYNNGVIESTFLEFLDNIFDSLKLCDIFIVDNIKIGKVGKHLEIKGALVQNPEEEKAIMNQPKDVFIYTGTKLYCKELFVGYDGQRYKINYNRLTPLWKLLIDVQNMYKCY